MLQYAVLLKEKEMELVDVAQKSLLRTASRLQGCGLTACFSRSTWNMPPATPRPHQLLSIRLVDFGHVIAPSPMDATPLHVSTSF